MAFIRRKICAILMYLFTAMAHYIFVDTNEDNMNSDIMIFSLIPLLAVFSVIIAPKISIKELLCGPGST